MLMPQKAKAQQRQKPVPSEVTFHPSSHPQKTRTITIPWHNLFKTASNSRTYHKFIFNTLKIFHTSTSLQNEATGTNHRWRDWWRSTGSTMPWLLLSNVRRPSQCTPAQVFSTAPPVETSPEKQRFLPHQLTQDATSSARQRAARGTKPKPRTPVRNSTTPLAPEENSLASSTK